jgi:NADH:ubiquinone oxidoreductase subunit K
MNLHEWKAKFIRGRTAVALWSVLGVLGLATLIRNVLSWNGWFNSFLLTAIVTDPKTGQMGVKARVFWIFAVLVASTVAIAALLIRSEINLGVALKVKNERTTIAFKTLQGMMWAANRLRHQHFPSSAKVKKCVRSVKAIFRIHKNFDTDVEQHWCIRAGEEAVNFWTVTVRSTSEADGAEYLDDINFKVKDASDNGVVYLPTENDPRTKKVVLYFLPQIEPGKEERQITMTYSWPGLFNQLKNRSSEEFSWTTDSLSAIEKIEFLFYLEEKTGFFLQVENIGPEYGKVVPQPISDGDQWKGFSYVLENVPAGKCEVGLLLRLKRP